MHLKNKYLKWDLFSFSNFEYGPWAITYFPFLSLANIVNICCGPQVSQMAIWKIGAWNKYALDYVLHCM